jgi:hypothetical protein
MCNTKKSKRLKILTVGGEEKNQLDCHHHMRNLCLGKEAEHAMVSHLTELLCDSLNSLSAKSVLAGEKLVATYSIFT